MSLASDLLQIRSGAIGAPAAEARVRQFIRECADAGKPGPLASITAPEFAAQIAAARRKITADAQRQAALNKSKHHIRALLAAAKSAGVASPEPNTVALRSLANKIHQPQWIKAPDQEWYNLDAELRRVSRKLRQMGIK